MSLLTRAWVTYGRLRRRIGKPAYGTGAPRRYAWIREHVPGRSFADIGGLFALHGEVALVAADSGASAVSLFDVGDVEFTDFPRKAQERGIETVRFVQGDLEDPVALAQLGKHDIVWCRGVIYHSPNPVQQLMHLRKITGELLFLGSHTVPEVPGLPHACVYYPFLDERTRSAIAAAHMEPDQLWGIGTPFNDAPMLGHGNFWWGITPSALRAMLATARFEVVEEWRDREWPFLTELVAKPVDKPPLLPPLSYFRNRRTARDRGDELPAWRDYYDREPSAWT